MLALMVLWAGCRRDTDPPAEPTTPQPPTVNMGVGDTTAMLVHVIDSVFRCGHNTWWDHRLAVPGEGNSAVVLGMIFNTSLTTSSSTFRVASATPGDLLFNGRTTTDTIWSHVDSVLSYVDMSDPPFYRLQVTYTQGCGVEGELDDVRGSSYVHLYHAGAQVDGTAYAGLDGALCYSSGSTLNAPVQEWINDTTRLYRTWINLNDCYPRMDVDELVHIAFAREANGAMK
ncbi:MAG: hypothetical protein KF797_13615, partial [Flavobacteriales bacterium]|nr:hypothetical protein [Flavobacteriales bacterium]